MYKLDVTFALGVSSHDISCACCDTFASFFISFCLSSLDYILQESWCPVFI